MKLFRYMIKCDKSMINPRYNMLNDELCKICYEIV